MTEEDWKAAASVLSTYETILFTAPSIAPALSNLIMKELLAEMTTEGRKFTFLCGHDSTIASCLAALEAEDYELPLYTDDGIAFVDRDALRLGLEAGLGEYPDIFDPMILGVLQSG